MREPARRRKVYGAIGIGGHPVRAEQRNERALSETTVVVGGVFDHRDDGEVG